MSYPAWLRLSRRVLKRKVNGVLPWSVPVWAIVLFVLSRILSRALPRTPLSVDAARMPLIAAVAGLIFLGLFAAALWRAFHPKDGTPQ